MNLDGGGSTTLSVLLPGSSAPAVDNSPSGGSLRACATFILLVTDAPHGPGAGAPGPSAGRSDRAHRFLPDSGRCGRRGRRRRHRLQPRLRR
ncbi:MAG: hypothetical protein ACLT3D_09525 [Lawsonibacter sp.]